MIYEAFCALSRSRGSDFGHPQPIPVVAIMASVEFWPVPQDDRMEWLFLIQSLDQMFLKVRLESISEQRKREQEQAAQNGGR